jgi:L,D-transpeptidase YcbB
VSGSISGCARFLGVMAAALGAMAATPIAAQDIRFGPPSATTPQPTDRAYIRQWEANPPPGFPTLSKANIEPTRAAIKRYTDVVARGGWKALPDSQLQEGTNAPAVGLLKAHLVMSGDLKDGDTSGDGFDYTTEKAVRRFQAENGLTPTGIVDKRTIAALNIPADVRLRQLKANLGRLTELAVPANRRYIVVNIPAAQVEAIEGDHVVARHAGVVGKAERPTPLLHTSIHTLKFNPDWTLPPTVIEKDLIPRGREMQHAGKNVLVKFGIDAYDGTGKKLDPEKINWSSGLPHALSYRQKPGKDNPLGFLKMDFESAESVYMHDTPSESLFGRNFRAASSGCVRVQNIDALAAWILADEKGWDADRVAEMRKSGERLDLRLKRPMPLHFVYVTAWATEDGVIQFRRDLYKKDGVGPVAADY